MILHEVWRLEAEAGAGRRLWKVLGLQRLVKDGVRTHQQLHGWQPVRKEAAQHSTVYQAVAIVPTARSWW